MIYKQGTMYSNMQGYVQDLTSREGLWGGTYTLVYDLKGRLENFGTETFFAIRFGAHRPSAPAGYSPANLALLYLGPWSSYAK